MTNSRNWPPITLVALGVLALSAAAQGDYVCPLCAIEPLPTVGASELVELVLSTVLRKGVAVLLLGATAIVGLPWLVAGVAAAAFVHVPPWLRAWF